MMNIIKLIKFFGNNYENYFNICICIRVYIIYNVYECIYLYYFINPFFITHIVYRICIQLNLMQTERNHFNNYIYIFDDKC